MGVVIGAPLPDLITFSVANIWGNPFFSRRLFILDLNTLEAHLRPGASFSKSSVPFWAILFLAEGFLNWYNIQSRLFKFYVKPGVTVNA